MEPQTATPPRPEDSDPAVATAASADGAEISEAGARPDSATSPDTAASGALAAELDDTEATSASTAADESLPAISEPEVRRAGRTGFWRRIAMRRSHRKARKLAEAMPGDAVIERVERLDTRVAGIEDTLAVHFERLEVRFAQLWELEESLGNLGEVHRKLDELIAQSEQQAQRAKASSRRALLLGLLGGLALAAISFALVSAL